MIFDKFCSTLEISVTVCFGGFGVSSGQKTTKMSDRVCVYESAEEQNNPSESE